MALREWSLSEAARLLNHPQHRLIYLCEKGVVVPDFGDAKGRGSSRRFSARNLLEFAVALRLRELTIPVGPVAAIIHCLRLFETAVAREIPDFRLTESLRQEPAPDLRIIIRDGERLYFSLRLGSSGPKLYGGLDFHRLASKSAKPGVLRKELAAAWKARAKDLHAPTALSPEFGGPEGSKQARIEVSVTQIARDLPLGSESL